MNPILVILFLSSVLNSLLAAPAVSSVYVRFVSGNTATQYAHGSLGDGTSLQYNIINAEAMNDQDHRIQRRSTLYNHPTTPSRRLRKLIPTTEQTEISTLSQTEPNLSKLTIDSMSGDDIHTDNIMTWTTRKPCKNCGRRRVNTKSRIKFINDDSTMSIHDQSASSKTTDVGNDSPTNKLEAPTNPEQLADEGTIKPKDTKAVKRSPFPSEKFGSFNFPEFDEFGGNEFGPLANYRQGTRDTAHVTSSNLLNAESLAPEGLFLPPLPTAASNHVDDPYLADAESAKYAAQQPPYFHEFPHKRTVLSLNEQREENGLEPNILRSIRPFFPFFEINKRRRRQSLS